MTLNQFMFDYFSYLVVALILVGHLFSKYFPDSTNKEYDDLDKLTLDPINEEMLNPASMIYQGPGDFSASNINND
jgi:hypothetical protein